MVTFNIKSVTSMPPEAAIGQQAGAINQGSQAIAMGKQAGYQNQGANAIAIGAYAGFSNQAAGSIVLNASGANVNATTSGFYVNPVRSVTSSSGLVSYSANEMIVTSNVIMNTVTATTFVGNGSQLTGVFTPMTISNVQITSNTWTVLDDMAVSTTDAGYCLVNGSGFAPGSMVRFGTDLAPSVAYVSGNQLKAQTPPKSSGSYDVTVIRGDTTTSTLALGISYSPSPVWSTSTDLGSVTQNISFTRTLAATSDSNVTYANTSALPPQTTLTSNGTLSGNITSVSSDTMYTFNIKATDLEYQDVLRTFQVSLIAAFGPTDLAITMGENSSFIIARASGTNRIYSFGRNNAGQLGTTTNAGTNNTNPTPINIMANGSLSGKSVLQIAGGQAHTMALCSDKTLHGFGSNYWGVLGSNTNVNPSLTLTSTPINVTNNGSLNGKIISSIACGGSHTVVLCTDGTVHTFGYNDNGQLGNGSVSNSVNSTPTNISSNGSLSGKTASKIACGFHFTIVLCTDGSLIGFGNNYQGQLGTNSNPTSTPAQVTGGSLTGKSITKISCGYEHTLIVCSDGTLHVFGSNYYGQLGTATNAATANPNPTPQQISAGSLAGKTISDAVGGGSSHSMILCSDGTLHSFGYNYKGQLGTSTNSGTGTANPTPTQVTGGTLSGKSITKVSTGYNHTIVLCSDGSLHSFGYNYQGQLGTNSNNGTNNANPTPVNITASVVQ